MRIMVGLWWAKLNSSSWLTIAAPANEEQAAEK